MKFGMPLPVVVFGFLLVGCDTPQTSAPAPTTAPVQVQAVKPQPPPEPVAPMLPADEQAFISVVSNGQAAFRAAPNEMAQGGTRSQRRLAICRNLPQVSVSNWVGRIEKLSSNSDGKGVLEISVAHDIRVETWNNDVSDLSDKTLIDPSSPLFAVVSQMKQGDQVLFSGSFIPSDIDCVKEASMSLEGSMTDPEFLFRFTTVSAMGTSQQ